MTFAKTKEFLDKIAPLAGLNDKELELLKTPQNILKADLNVNGKTYPAFRVQFNNARGPFKGGIRFHPEVDEDEVTSLSFWMSLKTAVANIPLGGGKGGVTVNPKELNGSELEELSRAYMRAFYEQLGPQKDVPAPDVYTTPQIMAWMRDEYEKLVGHPAPGVITGKPLEQGGSKVRDIATALGGVYILEKAVEKLGISGRRVAIQGFGNAGSTMAKLLEKKGFTIIAVSDSRGGIYNKNGLDIEKVFEVKKETRSVQNYEDAQKIDNHQILEVDCDILVPAALDNVITKENASKINAKIIGELANGPTTLEADEILHSNKVVVLPDVLFNSGGVTVSYFEWLQNNANSYWEADVVKEKLKEKMVAAFGQLYDAYKLGDHNFRTTAYIHAIKKIIAAEKERGRV